VTPQLYTALGLGIRELAQVLAPAMAAAGALAMAAVGARRARWRLVRARGRAVSAGPWAPVERGVAVLLEGGPARFRAAAGTIIVENGGALVFPARRSGGTAAGRDVVVGQGETLRVCAADLGDPEHFLGSGEAVWLCAGSRSASPASSAPPAARHGGRPPA
jgi:hypothetical protein